MSASQFAQAPNSQILQFLQFFNGFLQFSSVFLQFLRFFNGFWYICARNLGNTKVFHVFLFTTGTRRGKEGGAGQVMFPGWLDQPPWKHHRDKARQRRKEGRKEGREGRAGDVSRVAGSATLETPQGQDR